MNKGLNLYFSETSWNQQQKCEVMSLTDIFSIILPTTDEWKVSKCNQSILPYLYSLDISESNINQFHFFYFFSSFVPYVGIVTILMNDYPKFKVSLQNIQNCLFRLGKKGR
jgi:hypothetical protein